MRLAVTASLLLSAACAGARPATVPAPAPQPPLALGVDLHVHLTMQDAATPLFKGEAGAGPLAASPRTRLHNQVDAAQLQASGVRLLFGALWPPMRARPGRTALDEALSQVDKLDAFAARHPAFAVVRSEAEARRALSLGRLAVLPQVEGGEGLGSVEDVDLLYAAGVRCITVVHFVNSQLAGAARGQLSRHLLGAKAAELEPSGLTPLGQAVVARMMDLGIVIDLAHASDRTVDDVLALSTPRGVPIIVSHTGARALMDFERNLTDDGARKVAQAGGLVGVTLFPAQLETPGDAALPGHQHGTCDDFVAHWRHFASVVPPEQVALGTDFNGFIVRPGEGGLCAGGLRNTGDLNALWAALVAQGVPRAALDGMGERTLQLLRAVEAKADKAAQARALLRRAELAQRKSRLFDVP